MTCKTGGCSRIATVRGWCSADYQLLRRQGRMVRVYKASSLNAGNGSALEQPRPTNCGVEGCDKPPITRGLCARHYARLRAHGDPLTVRPRGAPPVERVIPNETSPTKLAKLLGVSRQRAHQLLNKEAHNARSLLANAVATGKVTKPETCERCQTATADLEAHHWDYREALDVRWLCPPCHSIVHPHHPYSRTEKQQDAA